MPVAYAPLLQNDYLPSRERRNCLSRKAKEMDEPKQDVDSRGAAQTPRQVSGKTKCVTDRDVRNRRDFLTKGGTLGILAAATGAAGLSVPRKESGSSTAPGQHFTMVIDLSRCTGCRACAVACKAEHNVPLGNFRSYVNQVETVHGSTVKRHFLPRMCNHCEHPPCAKVCPVGATYRREDGVVAVRKDRCIGCRYCTVACPYGARCFQWHRGDSGDGLDWPSRTYGVVDKCDLCLHRIENGVEPACVNTCPANARVFGDMADPESEVSRLIAEEVVTPLAPELGTKPSVAYVDLDYVVSHASLDAGSKLDVVQVDRETSVET